MAASEPLDLESIGAFIDGRLTGAARERIVKLLDESEEAFEIYADALRARLDVDPAPPIPIPIPSRRPVWRWVVAVPALAAAALVAVIPRMNAIPEPGGLIAATIVAPLTGSSAKTLMSGPEKGQVDLAVALGPGWEQQSWAVMRGGGSALVDSTAALRLGVRATDLQVALVLRNRELAAEMSAEMVSLVRPLNVSEGAVAEYEAIRTRITAGDSLGQIAYAVARADTSLGEFLQSPWFGFGKWFAAGELAAKAGSTAFFASRDTRKFLESAIGSGRLAPEDVERLRQVGALAGREMSQRDFKTVQETFAELIRRYGG